MKYQNIIIIFISLLFVGIAHAAVASLNITINVGNQTCNQSSIICGSWGSCSGSIQFRSCNIFNYTNICNNTYSFNENQSCTVPSGSSGGGRSHHTTVIMPVCDENKLCGNWSDCINSHQDRICNQIAYCYFETRLECAMPVQEQNIPIELPKEESPPESPPQEIPPEIKESTLWEKFQWWLNNQAPAWAVFIYNAKWTLLIILILLLLILWLLKKSKKKNKPTVKYQSSEPAPKPVWLYYSIIKSLNEGIDKYFIIEYWKKKRVNDEDLERIFAYIERRKK